MGRYAPVRAHIFLLFDSPFPVDFLFACSAAVKTRLILLDIGLFTSENSFSFRFVRKLAENSPFETLAARTIKESGKFAVIPSTVCAVTVVSKPLFEIYGRTDVQAGFAPKKSVYTFCATSRSCAVEDFLRISRDFEHFIHPFYFLTPALPVAVIIPYGQGVVNIILRF